MLRFRYICGFFFPNSQYMGVCMVGEIIQRDLFVSLINRPMVCPICPSQLHFPYRNIRVGDHI